MGMRRVVVHAVSALALLLTLGIGLSPATASMRSSASAITETATCDPGPEALLIGDSLVARAGDAYTNAFTEVGWSATVVAHGGRTARWGLTQLQEQLALAPHTRVVIVALGTNDTRLESSTQAQDVARLRKYVDAVGDQRTLLWVNVALKPDHPPLYQRYVREAEFNSALVQVAVESRNFRVIDWKGLLTIQQFFDDGVHYLPEAYPLRGTLIAESALSAACEVVRALETRTISLSIKTASGVPVTGGSITWSSEGGVVKGPVGLTSRGVVGLPSTPPGLLQVSLRMGVLPGGVKVSGTWRVGQDGQPRIALRVPDPPALSTRHVRVNVAGNRRVIGAQVRVDGLSGRVTVGGFTYVVNRVFSGATSTTGLFTARGFAMNDSPSATVEYTDDVIRRRAENVVVNREFTVVRLPGAPYLGLPKREIRAQKGELVPVTARLFGPAGKGRESQASLEGVEVSITPPAGSSQTCPGATLTAKTDFAGRASLAVCATQSGTFRVSAPGAITTAALSLLVLGGAPGIVTELKATSPSSRHIRVSWSPPDFIGGRSVPISRYTVLISDG